MAQIWAWTAAAHHGVSDAELFSGGTETTAFNARAVAALRRAHFDIRVTRAGENPVHEVRFREGGPAMLAFSKACDHAPNPQQDFCAVMTCSRAGASCPVVRGASLRIEIPYEDPADFDGIEQETAAYDDRCRQIGREMLYLFSRVSPAP